MKRNQQVASCTSTSIMGLESWEKVLTPSKKKHMEELLDEQIL